MRVVKFRADSDDTNFALSTATAPGRRSLKRVAELFAIDQWGSDFGFVEKAWRSHSEPDTGHERR